MVRGSLLNELAPWQLPAIKRVSNDGRRSRNDTINCSSVGKRRRARDRWHPGRSVTGVIAMVDCLMADLVMFNGSLPNLAH